MPKQPPPSLEIHPPLLNSSNPWASTLDDLRILYACPSTGAVTTRTSLIHGFPHDDTKHQYIFFDPATHAVSRESPCPGPQTSTLNSLGYSPFPLQIYLDYIKTISSEQHDLNNNNNTIHKKGFIISVTGTPSEISTSYNLISQTQLTLPSSIPLAIEINLSCPNIPDKPPPAYSRSSLGEYLSALKHALSNNLLPRIPIGLKTPPYTYTTQFDDLISALVESCDDDDEGENKCLISFLTATNTLGSCLAFEGVGDGGSSLALPGKGLGGLAGAAIHPLALGNVATLRGLLDGEDRLRHVRIVGVGGVSDGDGYRRMRGVGARFVGIGTGLGLRGVGVFREIEGGLEGRGGW